METALAIVLVITLRGGEPETTRLRWTGHLRSCVEAARLYRAPPLAETDDAQAIPRRDAVCEVGSHAPRLVRAR